MSLTDIHAKLDVTFVDNNLLWGFFASEQACGLRQPLTRTTIDVTAFVERLRTRQGHQFANNHRLRPLSASGGELSREHIAILVNRNPGQAIRFGIDDTQRIRVKARCHLCTNRKSGGELFMEEGLVDRRFLAEMPHTNANLRLRRPCTDAQYLPRSGTHADGFTQSRCAVNRINRARKNPRMPQARGTITFWL